MAETKTTLGMGEFAVANSSTVLETIGLGSCLGVCIWDQVKHIGGLSHIMLGYANGRTGNPMRFADKAIDVMIDKMIFMGCRPENMIAKIFGAASLFENSTFDIGGENVKSVTEVLERRRIPIVARDTGGNHGRSIWFDTNNGSVVVGSVFGPTKEY